MKKVLFLTVFVFALSASCLFAQGPNYWQQRAEYKMDINVDAENHQFTGTQELTYYNNSPDTLTRVFYHLYFNAFQPNSMMDVRSRTIEDPDGRVRDRIFKLSEDEIGYHKIDALTQDGQEVNYKVDGTILEVELADSILPGEETVFNMEFHSQIPLQIRRSGWNNAEGVEFSMSQWYPKISEYDEKGWHPNPYIGREFYGVWGDFEVNITIDAAYVMGATGHLQNPNEIGHGYQTSENFDQPTEGTLTWKWKAEKVHDFMWGADPDFKHIIAQVPNGPKLHFFYQQDEVAKNADRYTQEELTSNWEQLPEYTVKAFQYMSETFGKYPYDKFSVIQGGDGGMEYPMGTLITGNRSLGSLVGVTVHELIHMWYYGVLGTNESLYPWIDEGFTTYASAHTMQHLFNPNASEDPVIGRYGGYFGMQKSGNFEALDTHADHFETNGAYGLASYTTGAIFLNQLRYIVGTETFYSGMKRFFNTWKFKHPSGQAFLRTMEEESGLVLDWYYQYFINTTKTIDYGITTVADREDETVVTLERNDLTPMPIDLLVEYKDGSKELFYIPLRIMRGEKNDNEYPDAQWTVAEDWPWVNPTYSLSIAKPAADIKSIEIDPSQRMADINRENNVMNMEEYMQEAGNK